MDLPIVIPTYNEEHRLAHRLTAAQEYIGRQDLAAEIVVSDDGSTDRTVKVAAVTLSGTPHQILRYGVHRGKGAAVRRGMLAASGKNIMFADADQCTPFDTLDLFWPWINQGYDIVIGSRYHNAAIREYQPLLRSLLGQAYLRLANLIIGTAFSDINCGFKLFRRDAAYHLFGLSLQNDWTFDAEILSLAQEHHYTIKEVPIAWRHQHGTKVRLRRDIPTSLMALVVIRMRSQHRRYGG